MSISVSDELQLFAQEIQSLLSSNTLQNLARDVGFVQREGYTIKKDKRGRWEYMEYGVMLLEKLVEVGQHDGMTVRKSQLN